MRLKITIESLFILMNFQFMVSMPSWFDFSKNTSPCQTTNHSNYDTKAPMQLRLMFVMIHYIAWTRLKHKHIKNCEQQLCHIL